jgi:hypothetical protein
MERLILNREILKTMYRNEASMVPCPLSDSKSLNCPTHSTKLGECSYITCTSYPFTCGPF